MYLKVIFLLTLAWYFAVDIELCISYPTERLLLFHGDIKLNSGLIVIACIIDMLSLLRSGIII